MLLSPVGVLSAPYNLMFPAQMSLHSESNHEKQLPRLTRPNPFQLYTEVYLHFRLVKLKFHIALVTSKNNLQNLLFFVKPGKRSREREKINH